MIFKQGFELLFTVLFFYSLISTSYYLYKVRKTKSKTTNESKDALRLVFLAFFLYGCGILLEGSVVISKYISTIVGIVGIIITAVLVCVAAILYFKEKEV